MRKHSIHPAYHDVQTAYRAARKRLLLFDYDGTLTPIVRHPSSARVSPILEHTLTALVHDARNTVAIISGRRSDELEERFSFLPLVLVAEHGATVKLPSLPWKRYIDDVSSWIQTAESILKRAAETVPNSFVETKQYSVAWHTRQSDRKMANLAFKRLQKDIEPLMASSPVVLLSGKRVIEVRHKDAHKGNAAAYLLANGKYDFVLGAGDDATDEDLFAAIPDGVTIHVGNTPTRASVQIGTVRQILAFLRGLQESQ